MNQAKNSPADVLVRVENLKKHFSMREGLFRRQVSLIRAVDDVSFDIHRGETLTIVGESGSGKSTMGRTILQLMEPTAGEIYFDGQGLTRMRRNQLRKARQHMTMIFQNPFASLNPRMTVGGVIREPLQIHGGGSAKTVNMRIKELLALVGLNPYFAGRYPHEFSGGQRLRISIARALATKPSFLVVDDPLTTLDVSLQRQIVTLLAELKAKLGLTYLLTTRNLTAVRQISDRIAILQNGRIVEIGERDEIYENPQHPHTQTLIQQQRK